MTDYFLEDEWQRWKSGGMQASGGTAVELIQRMKASGAKNLDEYSKKRLVAIWLFSRGDGRTTGVAARAVAAEQFKQRIERALRIHEPEEYIQQLPPVDVYEVDHAQMFAKAFPQAKPRKLSDDDMAQLTFIDGMSSCRGNMSRACHPQGHGQHEPTQQMLDVGSLLQTALQQFGLLRQQPHDDNIDIRMVQGRPMRSMQNCASPSSQGSPAHQQPRVVMPEGSGMLALPPFAGAPHAPTPAAQLQIANVLPAVTTPGHMLAIANAHPAGWTAPPGEPTLQPNALALPASDTRDDIAAVAAAMLNRKKKRDTETCGTSDDEEEVDAMPARKKRANKGAKKKKTTATKSAAAHVSKGAAKKKKEA